MGDSAPPTRIGDAERAAAQRALQVHLDAGRLQLAEFVQRFGAAADAVTAADVAALFVDLPAPHPTLPRRPSGRPGRHLVVVGAVAVLVLGGLLGFVVGRGRTPAAPVAGSVAAPTPAAPPPFGPLTSPEGPAADALVGRATVRWTTGPGLITLRPSFGIDLDEMTTSTWTAGSACCDRDVGFAADAGTVFIDGGHAAVSGPLEFATCLHETAYTGAAIARTSLRAGQTICVRTNNRRLALVTIVSATEQAVEFGATVWDPPVPW